MQIMKELKYMEILHHSKTNHVVSFDCVMQYGAVAVVVK